MTTIGTAALQVRLREVIEAGFGSIRTIAAATYGGALPPGVSPEVEAVRALALPQIECAFGALRKHGSSPMLGSVALYELDVEIRCVRRLTAAAQLVPATRDAAKAYAAADADVLAQALTWPGQLTATQAGAATGLVSGMLSYLESAIDTIAVPDDGSAIIETKHRFVGVMQSAPPI